MTTPKASITKVTSGDLVHRFTRRQYHQIGELGFFDNKHVELLRGMILDMPTRTIEQCTVKVCVRWA